MYRQAGTTPNFTDIARRYGMNRHTVAKYWKAGGQVEDARRCRPSGLDRHREVIEAKAQLPGATKRGIYGGACGYLSFGGEMDVAIAIRTGVIKDGMLYVQAAAGIVADSIAEMEWQETENKARAVLRAAEQVQDGLDGEF